MSEKPSDSSSYFHFFQSSIEGIALPDRFCYPFNYVPHQLAMIAAKELQKYLETQTDWEHDFGMDTANEEIIVGKMFGVLVVKNLQGELGYLCAVSGKLAGHNSHTKFVPPVFDILVEDGFFKRGESIISEINERIFELEASPEYILANQNLLEARKLAEQELTALKLQHKNQREQRHRERQTFEEVYSGDQLAVRLDELDKQSINDHYHQKQLKRQWKEKLAGLEKELQFFQTQIEQWKEERRNRSAALQDEIFEKFYFVNKALERKSVGDIFKNTPEGKPMAGAGECAAPKLFQYAFLNTLEPIALAEFWWGHPPKTEIRTHGHFYPACRGKCEPILGHMLQGMDIEENPMLKNPAEGKDLDIVWEDEHIVIVNKPHEFLSVPGKNIEDSVQTRLKTRYPEHKDLLVVHRLDMSTSGLLIAAKTLDVYKALQSQFLQRLIKKRYVALLEGVISGEEGMIDLPMRVDLDNRPRQMVCFEYGKPALTRWEIIDRINGRTKVYFYPLTGRTHQLRVHAAHTDGLNHPIVGDDLYGTRSNRLHLHAERVEFDHPVTKEKVVVEVQADF